SARHDRVASTRIARPSCAVHRTMKGPIVLGRMWRNAMRRCRTPSERAASTYCISRIESTLERITRAARGMIGIEIAMITLWTAGPSAADITSASTRSGNPWRMSRIRTPPAARGGFVRAKRARVVHVPARGRAPAATAISTRLTAIADPRIENAVEHVDQQIAEDHDHGDEHDEVLHDRIVTPENRLNQEARDPRQVEDGLGDHEAADEKRELDADDGDDRQQGGLERVAQEAGASAPPVRPRRA